MARPRLLLATLLLGGAFASTPSHPCLAQKTRDRIELLEADVRALQELTAQLEQGQRALSDQLEDVRAALGLTGGQGGRTPADLAARLDTVEGGLRVFQENQRETQQRLSVITDRLDALFRSQEALIERLDWMAASQGAAAAGAPPLPPSGEGAPPVAQDPVRSSGAAQPPPVGADPSAAAAADPALRVPDPAQPLVDPEQLYQAARADYGRGSYQMAVAGFREFLEVFPQSDLADNARYWIGESYFAEGKHAEALAAFTEVVEMHPTSEKLPDAEYKRGMSLLEVGRTADGIIQLQRVRDSWPDTAAARLARGKLQSLGL